MSNVRLGIYDNLDLTNLNTSNIDEFNKALIGCRVILYSGGTTTLGAAYLSLNLTDPNNQSPHLYKKVWVDTATAADGVFDISSAAGNGFSLVYSGAWAICALNNPDLSVVGSRANAMTWNLGNLRTQQNILYGKLYTSDTQGQKNYMYEYDKATIKVGTEKTAGGGGLPGDSEWAVGITTFSDAMIQWFVNNSLQLRNQCCQSTLPSTWPPELVNWCKANFARACTGSPSPVPTGSATGSPMPSSFSPVVVNNANAPQYIKLYDLPEDKPFLIYKNPSSSQASLSPMFSPSSLTTRQTILRSSSPSMSSMSSTRSPSTMSTSSSTSTTMSPATNFAESVLNKLRVLFKTQNTTVATLITIAVIIVSVLYIGFTNARNPRSRR